MSTLNKFPVVPVTLITAGIAAVAIGVAVLLHERQTYARDLDSAGSFEPDAAEEDPVPSADVALATNAVDHALNDLPPNLGRSNTTEADSSEPHREGDGFLPGVPATDVRLPLQTYQS